MLTREDIAPVIEMCRLSKEAASELLVHANNPAIHTDIASLNTYAHFFSDWHGDKYRPRISSRTFYPGTVYCIEPECGSTTWVIDTKDRGELFVIDTGFPAYQEDLLATLHGLITDFDVRKKTLVLTHMDMDHAGLLSCFDAIYMSKTSLDDFRRREQGMANLRERVQARAPYYRITSILSHDSIADTKNMHAFSDVTAGPGKALSFLGHFKAAAFDFEVYETSGGHVEGSVILIERNLRLVFAGDTFVNSGMRKEQMDFIKTSMAIMGSLNADSGKARLERAAMFMLLEGDGWVICGGHGGFSEYP